MGQCSATVALPVLSALGHETCLLPTALLSTHTGGFGKPAIVHFDRRFTEIWQHWKRNAITFDAILVGYLGSIPAVRTAGEVISQLLAPGGAVIVDPAMADHGKLYSGFDTDYVQAIRGLCRLADVILPNLTEAAMLSGQSYLDDPDEAGIQRLLRGLNCPNVILTGVGHTREQTGVILARGDSRESYFHRRLPGSYHGTGDLFAACFTGAWMRGMDLFSAVKLAADFTGRCIETTYNSPAHWYGVKFEPVLPELMKQITGICESVGKG